MSGVNAHAILSLQSSDATITVSSTGFAWSKEDMRAGLVPVGHPLLHSVSARTADATTSSSTGCEFAFLLQPEVAWLWDHQVAGRPLLPGAAYLELTAAAVRTLRLGSGYLSADHRDYGISSAAAAPIALAETVLAAPCVLPPPQQQTWLVLTCKVDVIAGNAAVYSSHGSGGAQKHMLCSLVNPDTKRLANQRAASGSSAYCVSIDAVRASCNEPLSSAEVYGSLAAAGLQYGPAHRLLAAIKKGVSGTAAARIATDTLTDGQGGYLLHPAGRSSLVLICVQYAQRVSCISPAQHPCCTLPA